MSAFTCALAQTAKSLVYNTATLAVLIALTLPVLIAANWLVPIASSWSELSACNCDSFMARKLEVVKAARSAVSIAANCKVPKLTILAVVRNAIWLVLSAAN